MRISRFLSCLFGLLIALPLAAQSHQNTGSLSVMSMPVECEVRVPAHDKAWVKKSSEQVTFNQLPAGEYDVVGRFEGQTMQQKTTIKPNEKQTVFLNFLAKDLSEIPVDSPAQEALKQLSNAQTYWQQQDIAKAWQAIHQARTLYSDDPEIQEVYTKINTERNRVINTLWTDLQHARRVKDRQAMLASLCQLQKISPKHPGVQQVIREEGISFNSLEMMMLRVKAGRFAMGCSQTVTDLNQLGGRHDKTYLDETPVHTVTISQPYLISATLVTVGQFRTFVAQSGYQTDAHRRGFTAGLTERNFRRIKGLTWEAPGFEQTDEHPVVLVTYNDANAFCQWLGKQEGVVYHLPTEAQWEYAARAGTREMFWWGNRIDKEKPQANLSDHALYLWKKDNFKRRQRDVKWDDSFVFTSPVTRFPANPWGMYDMLGNVSEWCRDWLAPYAATHVTDPQGPAQGKSRIIRGGSWASNPVTSRVSYRGGQRSNRAYTNIGFRIVREMR